MKAIIHIGTEKTGSTSLQEFLYGQKINLISQGVGLFECVGNKNNVKLVHYLISDPDYSSHYFLVNEIKNDEDNKLHFKDFEKEFSEEYEELNKNNVNICIFSSELFHSRLIRRQDIEKLKLFLSKYFKSVDIICYFREQSALAESLYSTYIKSGGVVDINNFYNLINPENYYFNYFEISNNWSSVFPSSFIALLYDKNLLKDSNICVDFVNRFLPYIELEKFDNFNFFINKKLNDRKIHTIKLINEIHPIHDNKNIINWRRSEVIEKIEAIKLTSSNSDAVSKDLFDVFKFSNEEFFNNFKPLNGSQFERKEIKSNISAMDLNEISEIIKVLIKEINMK